MALRGFGRRMTIRPAPPDPSRQPAVDEQREQTMSEQKTGAPSVAPPATPPTDIKRRDRYQVYSAYRDIDQATAEAPYLVAPKTDSDADTKMTIANLCLTPPATPLTSPEYENDDFR